MASAWQSLRLKFGKLELIIKLSGLHNSFRAETQESKNYAWKESNIHILKISTIIFRGVVDGRRRTETNSRPQIMSKVNWSE